MARGALPQRGLWGRVLSVILRPSPDARLDHSCTVCGVPLPLLSAVLPLFSVFIDGLGDGPEIRLC